MDDDCIRRWRFFFLLHDTQSWTGMLLSCSLLLFSVEVMSFFLGLDLEVRRYEVHGGELYHSRIT